MKKRHRIVDRRDALVRAAYSVIARKGFEGLRLREVATKAGIDHSTVHHHFRTKRDLIGAVLDYATEQFGPPRGNDAKPTALHEHLNFLAHMIVDRPELHVVLREFDLHATRDARVRAIIREREDGWRDRLAQRIQIAAEAGNWPSRFEPATGAELVIAVVKGASFNQGTATKVLNLLQELLARHSPARRTKRTRI